MKYYIFFAITITILSSCSRNYDIEHEYMSLEEVKYVNKMSIIKHLTSQDIVPFFEDEYYVKNMVVFDSLLFVDTKNDNGLVDILSTTTKKSYGCFLARGRANTEFSFGINLTLYSSFEHRNNKIFLDTYDVITGQLYSMDVNSTINKGKSVIEKHILSDKIPNSAFWVKSLSDTTVVYRRINDSETMQIRTIVSKTGNMHNKAFDILNEFEIPQDEDFNIMSTLVAISPSKDYIVEAMIGMNYVNVYSIKDGKGYTLCVGDKVDKLSEVLSLSKYNRKYVFADVRAYDFGFVLLKYDIKEKVFRSGSEYPTSLLLFDWNGKVIGEVTSAIQLMHFDYDERNGILYLLDHDNHLFTSKALLNVI